MLYLIRDRRSEVSAYMLTALRALRLVADDLVAVVDSAMSESQRSLLAEVTDLVVPHDSTSAAAAYSAGMDAIRGRLAETDELILTGNSWYGPVRPLDAVVERMGDNIAHAWQMTGNIDGPPESFPEEGFPIRDEAWLWLAVRRDVLASPVWARLWEDDTQTERDIAAQLVAAGFTIAEAFPVVDYPRGDPALFAPDLLIEDGFPFVSRTIFQQYPPFLDRHAVLGRELLQSVADSGLPMDEVWQDLARTVPPKALNAIAGMLEVLPERRVSYDPARPFRVVVIAYVPDVAFMDELRERLKSMPAGFDLVVVTGQGGKARAIETLVSTWGSASFAHFETRVCWVRRGRDKAAILIACRDLVLGDDYDLIVKVHGRTSSRKTANAQDYSRRHQLDNLLSSRGYVENLLGLFQREPGLGLVFPPMAHVGTAIMGRGWGSYRRPAEELCERLGLRVPLDRVSPLAPYGGMWVGRPQALRPLARVRWTDNDYGKVGRRRYVELGRVQERLMPLVAGELGYHCRTVLNREHAAISHTALEYKADQLFSTTRGYPYEQIRFLHTLGFTGHGGVVALMRMYLRANHPTISRAILPFYNLAYRTFTMTTRLRRGLRRALSGNEDDKD